MLVFPNDDDGKKAVLKIMSLALESGTLPALVDKLSYLNRYQDPDGNGNGRCRVYLYPSHRGEMYFDVSWKKPLPAAPPATWQGEWETWMNGGLLGRDNEWSVHT